MRRSKTLGCFAPPNIVVLLFMTASVVEYLSCVRTAGELILPAPLLIARGALIPAAIHYKELWRLFTAGFLHADPIHLSANMISLLIVGPPLERRLGGTTFALVYILALAGGGLASLLLHQSAFVSVGASGAIFGVLGALFALWALGADDISPSFFVANFALNFGIAMRETHIDWAAHIGGFVTGMMCIALLDIMSRVSLYCLRCKFPEFVKCNLTIIFGAVIVEIWFYPAILTPNAQSSIMAFSGMVFALTFVKIFDLILAVRHGLVGIVLLLAVSDAAVLFIGTELFKPALALQCTFAVAFGTTTSNLTSLLCSNVTNLSAICAGGAVPLILLMHAAPLRRGLHDVGFVGATFKGDRRREHGLVRPVRQTPA